MDRSFTLSVWALSLLTFAAVAGADDPSGLVRYSAPEQTVNEEAAVAAWSREHLPAGGPVLSSVGRIADATHIHRYFDLKLDGRRVVGVRVKLHYNRQGYIDASSGLPEELPRRSEVASTDSRISALRQSVENDFSRDFGRKPRRLDVERVMWPLAGSAKTVPALQFTLVDTPKGILRRWIAEEATGKKLSEPRVIRNINANAFRVYPGHSAFPNPESLTLPGLAGGAATLQTSRIWVRRDQHMGSNVYQPMEVDPNNNYVGSGLAPLPDRYTGGSQCSNMDAPGTTRYSSCQCTGDNTSCREQAFDGVNVFYHLESYREAVDAHFNAMGMSPDFFKDRALPVFVNFRSLDMDGNGVAGDETNNAAYVSAPCRDDEAIDRCLVFLPPAQIASSSTCGNNKALYSLAREAVVAVHEYQHYITDRLASILPGEQKYNVGDALHEGYSDYFAVSHVSSTAGTDVTLVGAYAFQECTPILREIGALQPFENNEADEDPHYTGITWASGLWQLRKEFGKNVVDRMALKSLIFLPGASSRPGFHDAVEGLVQADQALYAGAHADRIRELYYGELTFLGGTSAVFRDAKHGIAEVGFHSCAGVAPGGNTSGILSVLLSVLWLFGGVWIARRKR